MPRVSVLRVTVASVARLDELLLPRLGRSLTAGFRIVSEHLAIEEGQVGRGSSHVLHVLNHAHSVET